MKTKLAKMFMLHYEEWCLLSFSYLGDKAEAEEVVQDVCAAILMRKKTCKILNLERYIKVAIKNKSLKRIRYAKKIIPLHSENLQVQPSYEEHIIFHENQLLLKKALAKLPKNSKLVFQLCAIEGQKYHHVAKTLGLSVNTIKYHMKNAYKTLRSEIQSAYFLIICMINSLFL